MGPIRTSKKRFVIDFLNRTKDNLENSSVEHDMTNLINNCLGLIVFPCEFGKSPNHKPAFLGTEASEIAKQIGFRFTKFKPIRELGANLTPIRYSENDKTLEILLRKVRNGFAHQNIRPLKNGDKFDKIAIWNIFRRRQNGQIYKERDVGLVFTQEQLRSFSLFIADGYLRKMLPKAERAIQFPDD